MSGLFSLPTGFTNFAIGFDSLFDELNLLEDRLTRQDIKNNYPPHNLVKDGDHHFTLELAVAGFKQEEIEVVSERNTLQVIGKHDTQAEQGRYIHRGIGLRAFSKMFVLADNVIVDGASLEDGLLRISLTEVVPESQQRRLIPVSAAKQLSA